MQTLTILGALGRNRTSRTIGAIRRNGDLRTESPVQLRAEGRGLLAFFVSLPVDEREAKRKWYRLTGGFPWDQPWHVALATLREAYLAEDLELELVLAEGMPHA